jgi:hypothetical protein
VKFRDQILIASLATLASGTAAAKKPSTWRFNAFDYEELSKVEACFTQAAKNNMPRGAVFKRDKGPGEGSPTSFSARLDKIKGMTGERREIGFTFDAIGSGGTQTIIAYTLHEVGKGPLPKDEREDGDLNSTIVSVAARTTEFTYMRDFMRDKRVEHTLCGTPSSTECLHVVNATPEDIAAQRVLGEKMISDARACLRKTFSKAPEKKLQKKAAPPAAKRRQHAATTARSGQ